MRNEVEADPDSIKSRLCRYGDGLCEVLMGLLGAIDNRGLPSIFAIAEMQLRLVGALLLLGLARTALALPPVVATKDQHTKLDLTQGAGRDFRLLACGVRVAHEHRGYSLVNGTQRVPIPKMAIKAIQDNVWVEIAVNGKFLGIPLRAIWANIRSEAEATIAQDRKSEAIGPRYATDAVHYFLVTTPDQVLSAFQRYAPEYELHLVGESGEPPVVVVLSPPGIDFTTGYSLTDWHLSEWMREPPLVQVDFECRNGAGARDAMEENHGK